MTFDEFERFQSGIFQSVRSMTNTKGKEYANSEERFANFRRLASQLDLKDYQIGWVYLTKHLDAIANYCKKGESLSTETIESRIVDAITYLTLIAGMIDEAKNAV